MLLLEDIGIHLTVRAYYFYYKSMVHLYKFYSYFFLTFLQHQLAKVENII